MTGISMREFARRDGCSEGLVRRAIKQGRLKTDEAGKVDPSQVGTPWRVGAGDGLMALTTLAATLGVKVTRLKVVGQFE